MERIFNDIQKQIKEHLNDSVSLIDEDYGQLENLAQAEGDDMYPVTFPCVLISIPQIEWSTISNNSQNGKIAIGIRLAFDCYDDTHLGSTQEEMATERMKLASKLNSYLHGWRLDGCNSVMVRTQSRQFNMPGGIKVYEQFYTTDVYEVIADK